MAGSCIGFLVHNRYRESIFMGDTGSLALGGALAAMEACTKMSFPLFISPGVFVIEASSLNIRLVKSTIVHFQTPLMKLFGCMMMLSPSLKNMKRSKSHLIYIVLLPMFIYSLKN
ncbi:phospho-N-acetylmuramoyl-pentapeptide-transferase homolog isoform X2 [Papaver somniferum]|uniref:phospho-N-acetylmuramoyl-pentapeptide- transferase homolog isoform X2 n=1 Tax=Papaver somniferum TaxID=3469 RepID=UPI000E702052|nr:phospho-N-acetylmuramoyl-pentapeptide-transferase homolog isoform X2 [Papaver somniferum]